MPSRPVVSVFSQSGEKASTLMPLVFSTPLRSDLVHYVHTNMAKNRRQAYAVSKMSGFQTSARSWGTGRAMARVPRVKGGGTHRAGQAAYANFCRAGGMFAPTKTWRRWHRKVNLKEKRFALAVAVAASGVAPLVMARGHRIESVPEVPLVVDDSIETINKTKDAVALLQKLGLSEELDRVSKKKFPKRLKSKHGTGPLIILRASAVEGRRAFRNIPGVEVAAVERLNLLKLAPAGTLGRLCVWSKAAFEALDQVIAEKGIKAKPLLTNPDISALANSTAVQTALNPPKTGSLKKKIQRGASKRVLKSVVKALEKVSKKKEVSKDAKKALKKNSKLFFKNIRTALNTGVEASA
ncbi:60S ribosomal subunit protein L4/L1, putative [Theileria equi strain WA]|uniref:60S ribosomal subunit protein L4/L1, putative n=1 Tax=Theileria equi strain WA TaxID=1537102 RepID=L0AV84_THEEQ|nr:60S ribosomal subunit protein L4/L1, putative [Theileria equi strain WA]AFZ79522.1 60S ribosomal subunit protein L4/L1, putative [Theileria equi strain WA]|eukprot:XP_004829188.1 60S ribosomal subunit protein L4/L1, putative [Theileria equi strain WA]